MPGSTYKCKNKFCQAPGAAHRPVDKIKVSEMLNANERSDIRLCFDCKDLFDYDKEYTSNENAVTMY
jgi:hypothetical protein